MKDYSTNYLESERKNYRVPFIEFHDYERDNHLDISIHVDNNVKPEIINVACIQLGSELKKADPTEPIKLQDEELQKQKIINYIEESIAHGSNLIILPELSTSKSICSKIIKRYKGRNLVFVMGSYYDKDKQNVSKILINNHICAQIKNHPAYKEKDFMVPSNIVNVFLNTPVGDFAVLICYDATDFSTLMALQNYTDFIVCIACNRDVNLFDHMFRSITYLKYQYIIFCNNSSFGGSSIYAPFHGDRRLDTLGVDNEGIIYRKLDLGKIDELRSSRDGKNFNDLWKFPPANTRSRKSIYHNREEKHKNFKESTLNYFNCEYDILNRFLSRIYRKTKNTKSATHEITKSTDPKGADIMSIDSMYPKYYKELDKELCIMVREKFLESSIKDFCCNSRTNRNKNLDINKLINETNFIEKIKGNYYFLFEIKGEKLEEELRENRELREKLQIVLKENTT